MDSSKRQPEPGQRPRFERVSDDSSPPRKVRVPDHVWVPACEKANGEGKRISAVIRDLLRDYVEGSPESRWPLLDARMEQLTEEIDVGPGLVYRYDPTPIDTSAEDRMFRKLRDAAERGEPVPLYDREGRQVGHAEPVQSPDDQTVFTFHIPEGQQP